MLGVCNAMFDTARCDRWHLVLAVALLSVSGLVGCGEAARTTGQVEGAVNLGGSPLADGIVTFEDASQGVSGSARITAGRYKLDGTLPTGNYLVAVQPPPLPGPHDPNQTPAPFKVAERFRTPQNSGLTATIEEGNNVADFDVEP